MKLIYVAGPFRAANSWLVEKNIRRAEEASLRIWKQGGAALCPHTNTRFFDGTLPNEVFLQGTLEMLKRCDAIYLVTGWPDSKGSMAEKKYAEENMISVLYTEADLCNFLNRS